MLRLTVSSVVLSLGLLGCVSSPTPVSKSPEAPSASIGSEDAETYAVAENARTAMYKDKFVGQPVSVFEELAGQPAFIRKEGAGEFRRYDIGTCRIYVLSSGVTVSAISTGSVTAGADAPEFSTCF